MDNGAEVPVGQYLRSVRQSRDLKLEEASRVTKISKAYLVAIEEGEFEKLPNAAYIKGFIRLYAGFLSLSGDDVVARYERDLPAAPRPQAEPIRRRPELELMEKAKLGGHGRWVIPTLLLILVILAALFLSEEEEKRLPPEPALQAPVVAPPVFAPITAPVQQPFSSARLETEVTEKPTVTAPVPLPAGKRGGIVLRLRFNQDSWLSITIDDSISQRYDLKAGDIIEWKGSRLFVLDLGDGGAVQAEFNGRPLQALGEPGKPAHVELKSEQLGP